MTSRIGETIRRNRVIAENTNARLGNGFGRIPVATLLAVPAALAAISLALIWFGPGSSRLWALKVLLVAIGGLLLVLGRIAWTIARASRQIMLPEPIAALGPSVSIADALAGRTSRIVILRGVAEPADTATMPRSPLSETLCLYYELTVHRIEEALDRRREHPPGLQEHWEQIHRHTRSVTFWLRDPTGRILVDPTGALVGGAQGEGRRANFGPDDLAVRSLEDELHAAGINLPLPQLTGEHSRTVGYAIAEELLLPDWEVTVVGPLHERERTPIIARRGHADPFSIAVATDGDVKGGVRGLVAVVRLAAILLLVAGVAFLLLGFWLMLAR
jgi:hypothetical protein